ncbi:MAG: hypothetical protein IKV63_05865 [Clostridia bacterium]|nr:hypothetical protein [Clostridia bacterium]
MKKFLALTLALVMMLSMLAGCSSKKEEATTAAPTEAGPTADNTTVATSGTENIRTDFVYGTGFDIVGFDPPDCNDSYSGEMFTYVYDRLFQFDSEGEIQPMLVESYEQPSDTEFIFKIHEGVKFHNGDELTAANVVWSLNRASQNPKAKANFETVIEISEVSKYEFKIVTEKPFVPLLLNLAHSQTSILHQATVEAIEAGDGVFNETNMMGTGPMMLEYYKPNSELKMVRFDDYWQGACRATSITRKIIPEASSLTIALEAGEIDYINELNSIDIARVRENPDLKTVEMASANVAYMGLNTTKAPFDNVKVRQALQYASNKESIVEVLYEGFGVPCNSVFPTVAVAYNDQLDAYAYDIEKAKELLVEAGYPDGFEFEVVVSSDIRSRAAQILQQDYQSVGITVNIELMEFGAMLDYLSGKDHQAWIMSWSGSTNPNYTLTQNFHTESGGATGNRGWYSNPEVDAMIVEARGEFDTEKRNQLYKDIQAKLMEESPWIPLLQQTYVAGMGKGVDGVIMYKTGSRYYHQAVVYED